MTKFRKQLHGSAGAAARQRHEQRSPVEIEDILAMRRREGIDDVDLARDIQRLQVGRCVKLTFLFDSKAAESMLVRITSIRGNTFRGKLASEPVAPGLLQLRTGATIVFTAAHIHSIPRVTGKHV